MSKKALPVRSRAEEISNAASHGIGLILMLVALGVLLIAGIPKSPRYWVGYVVFGVALVVLYAFSTVYHLLKHPRRKALWRKFDHAAIFLVIAGTYTPIILVSINGPLAAVLLFIIWGAAVLGVWAELIELQLFPGYQLITYLLLGWFGILMLKPMLGAMPPESLKLLFIGGGFYTIGVAFYLMKWQFSHLVWHIFVLCGSVAQVLSILLL